MSKTTLLPEVGNFAMPIPGGQHDIDSDSCRNREGHFFFLSQ